MRSAVTLWEMGDGPVTALKGLLAVCIPTNLLLLKLWLRTLKQPREWTNRIANVVYYNKHDEGGHFPAANVPHLWMDEVRAFFSGETN